MRARAQSHWHTACHAYVACLVGAGPLLCATPARAACALELVPADAPAAWASAARAASARLSSTATRDCGSVEVAVRPSGGALLTFLTTDGRRAVRALMSPEEIAPALEALLVTLPPEAARSDVPSGPLSPVATPTRPTTPTAEAQPAPATSPPSAAPASSPEVHFLIGASAGVRFGLSGAYLSPALSVRPSGTFGAWELAGAVEYDPSYTYLPGGVPPGFKLWSFIAGMQVGRREAVGPVAIGYGVGLGVASIREEVDDTDGTDKVVDFGQPRGSLYGRLVLPRSSSLRATFELGVDAALANLKKRATLRNDLPDLPRWGIVVSVGIETSAL